MIELNSFVAIVTSCIFRFFPLSNFDLFVILALSRLLMECSDQNSNDDNDIDIIDDNQYDTVIHNGTIQSIV